MLIGVDSEAAKCGFVCRIGQGLCTSILGARSSWILVDPLGHLAPYLHVQTVQGQLLPQLQMSSEIATLNPTTYRSVQSQMTFELCREAMCTPWPPRGQSTTYTVFRPPPSLVTNSTLNNYFCRSYLPRLVSKIFVNLSSALADSLTILKRCRQRFPSSASINSQQS